MPLGNIKDKLEGNEIDLSLCNLSSVPVKELAEIPQATHLDLSCNLFDSLPDDFCRLTHLVKIDLSKNKLISLPEDFGQLVNLQHLDLLGNELTTLPLSFRKLDQLQWLDLKGNPLDSELQKQAGDCGDVQECQTCACNVLAYMNKLAPEMEKKNQKSGEKGSPLFRLVKLPVAILVAVVLAGFTMILGIKSTRDRLCDGTAADHVHWMVLRIVGAIGHVQHGIANIFR